MTYLVSAAEAAAMVKRDDSLIRRLCRQGRLPAQRIGSTWVLDAEDVRRFFAVERTAGRPRRATAPAPFRLRDRGGHTDVQCLS